MHSRCLLVCLRFALQYFLFFSALFLAVVVANLFCFCLSPARESLLSYLRALLFHFSPFCSAFSCFLFSGVSFCFSRGRAHEIFTSAEQSIDEWMCWGRWGLGQVRRRQAGEITDKRWVCGVPLAGCGCGSGCVLFAADSCDSYFAIAVAFAFAFAFAYCAG